MTELIKEFVSWHSLLLAVAVFGFIPGFLLRLLVKLYPRGDPRRDELIAQLYALGRLERPLFVAEQLETVLFEGLPLRVRSWSWKPGRRSSSPARISLRTPREKLNGVNALLGQHARVVQRIDELGGRVEISGETWRARALYPGQIVEPGTSLEVVEIKDFAP